jgi:hypothetical protein
VRTENTGCALYIRCALSTGKYGTFSRADRNAATFPPLLVA